MLGNIADCSSVRKACSRPELLPGIRVVTALALATEAAAVNVIIVVAARAAARQAERAVHWSAMAGKAIDALVAAVEPEAGLAVVVKLPALPVDRVVAGLASRSKSQLVRVVLAVAGNALSLGILEGRREVAILALDLDVLAEQREACESVIKARIGPAALTVAAPALPSFLALVLVVLAVT